MSTLGLHRRSADAEPSRATPAEGTGAHDAFYRRLIQGMRCGILTIDRSGALVMVNDHAGQILELEEQPHPGEPAEQVLHEYPQLVQILRESFSMSSLPNRAEIDLRCRSDRGKTIGFTLSLVRDDRGIPVGSAIFFKDLTHVEHREEQERRVRGSRGITSMNHGVSSG